MNEKVIFITGSAKRLGASTARYLHELGANIVLHCNQSVIEAQDLLDELNSNRANSSKLVVADFCDRQALLAAGQQAIAAFGRIDVLINNASAFYPTPLGTIDEQQWNELVCSNMQAPLYLSQLLQQQLITNQGVVINIADIHADRPLKDHTVYCMAKAALVSMTKSLANEMAPKVRVNAVAPGAILWPSSQLSKQDKISILEQIPLARLGTERDIASAIAFLINASYITGQVLTVDGGRSIAASNKA